MLINAVVVRSVAYKLKVTSTGGETLLFWQLFLSWLHTTVVVSQHKTSQIECKSFHTTLKDLLAYPRYWNPLLKEELLRWPQSEEVSWKFIVGQTTGNLSPATCWKETFDVLDCFVEDELGSSCAETLGRVDGNLFASFAVQIIYPGSAGRTYNQKLVRSRKGILRACHETFWFWRRLPGWLWK